MTDASAGKTFDRGAWEAAGWPDRRRALATPSFLLLLLAGFGGMLSFFLLLTVVPAYVAHGTGTDVAAGLATGAVMASTVATELLMPRVLARFGYRSTYIAGLLLLGGPALLLPLSSTLPAVLAVGLVRGVGLGAVVVASGAFVAEVVPRERLSEALGVYGAAVSLPAIFGLSFGTWLAPRLGYGPVFVAAAAAAIVAALAVLPLPVPGSAPGRSASMRAAFRRGDLLRPSALFLTTTIAAGITATFLPLALPVDLRPLAWVALLLQAVGATVARLAAGRVGDALGTGRLLLPAMAAASLGLSGLIWLPSAVTVLGGMLLFGIGFGVAQNATLALMFDRASRSEYGLVSAVWNLAYDAGMGIGAVGFGVAAQVAGYPLGLGLTTALLVGAMLVARRV